MQVLAAYSIIQTFIRLLLNSC